MAFRRKVRDPEKTRAHIVQVAFLEIYRNGFQGVSVRDIASKAGLTIGAFFHHFPSKTDVAHAIVDDVIRVGILERWIKPLSAYKNPIHGILKCYKKTFDGWPDELVQLGCPLNNLTQEMTSVDAAMKDKTSAVLREWIEETEKHLQRAKRDGYLKTGADPRVAAEFIVTYQEGTFAMGKALGDRRIFDSLYESFKIYLESISV